MLMLGLNVGKNGGLSLVMVRVYDHIRIAAGVGFGVGASGIQCC